MIESLHMFYVYVFAYVLYANFLFFIISDHGRCAQKIFNLNMLRRKQGICTVALQNGEKVVVDDWELYTQPIRVCCECTIDQRSFFAQYVPRDGDDNGDNVEPRKNEKGGSGKS